MSKNDAGNPLFGFDIAKVLHKSNMPFMPIYAKFIRHIGIKKATLLVWKIALIIRFLSRRGDISTATPRYFLAYEFGIRLWCALDAQGTILGQETVAGTAVGRRGHKVLLLPPGIASGKGRVQGRGAQCPSFMSFGDCRSGGRFPLPPVAITDAKIDFWGHISKRKSNFFSLIPVYFYAPKSMR